MEQCLTLNEGGVRRQLEDELLEGPRILQGSITALCG